MDSPVTLAELDSELSLAMAYFLNKSSNALRTSVPFGELGEV